MNLNTGNECSKCFTDDDIAENGLYPNPEIFSKYIPYFLHDNPSPDCAKAGHASYGPVIDYITPSFTKSNNDVE